MELRDFIVAPLVLVVVFLVAYIVRPALTDTITRRYFLPALIFRILGALAVGLIYQFYYGFGDTLVYHEGSRVIWDAFVESPSLGISLFLHDAESVYGYS